MLTERGAESARILQNVSPIDRLLKKANRYNLHANQ
jgi:hypothetical protein